MKMNKLHLFVANIDMKVADAEHNSVNYTVEQSRVGTKLSGLLSTLNFQSERNFSLDMLQFSDHAVFTVR